MTRCSSISIAPSILLLFVFSCSSQNSGIDAGDIDTEPDAYEEAEQEPYPEDGDIFYEDGDDFVGDVDSDLDGGEGEQDDGDGKTEGGLHLWSVTAGGLSDDYGNDISVFDDGTSIVTGHFRESATFGLGEEHETFLMSSGEDDIFVARYEQDGKVSWVRQAGGGYQEWGLGVSACPDGSSYVTGYLGGGAAVFGLGEVNEVTLGGGTTGSDMFVARYNSDGSLAWARSAGGSIVVQGNDVIDIANNGCLVIGIFRGTATFGGGEASETTITSDALDYDVFFARYNSVGDFLWVRSAGGEGYDVASGVSTLSDGSFYVAGNFRNTITFGLGEAKETSLTSEGITDIFLAKYNSDGTIDWAVSAGGAEGDYSKSVDVLPDGSSFMSGAFSGTATFGPGNANETTLTSAGGSDSFLARYSPEGALGWVKGFGGSGSDVANSVSTQHDGTCYVCGMFSDTTRFGEGERNETVLQSAGGTDAYIARYNPDGTLEWAKRVGGDVEIDDGLTHGDAANGISTLPDGSVMVTGYFDESAIFGPGENGETTHYSSGWLDIFVMKLSP